jgi:hypothetical protein
MTHGNDVIAAIEDWKAQRINSAQLMRRLIAHPTWQVPISAQAVQDLLADPGNSRIQYSRDDEGITRLYIFSDTAANNTFRELAFAQGEQHFISTTGEWVFQLPFDEIDTLVIDAGTTHEIGYSKAQFTRLHELAEAVGIEHALSALRFGTAGSGDALRVAQFPRYLLPVLKTDEGAHMCHAPDKRERQLAAVFTDEDAFELAYEELANTYHHGQIMMMRLSGAQLFEALKPMTLDGLVFNFAGPMQPIAFAPAFSQVMLDTLTATSS